MKRRDFFKHTIPATVTLPALINGFSVKAHTAHSALVQALLGGTTDTDFVEHSIYPARPLAHTAAHQARLPDRQIHEAFDR